MNVGCDHSICRADDDERRPEWVDPLAGLLSDDDLEVVVFEDGLIV